MENLLVDWVRHDAVRAKQFDHLSHHDYGRMEDETFFQKLQNGQDFGEKHVFDGNERTHWEYNLRARNSPGTVGICIDMWPNMCMHRHTPAQMLMAHGTGV